VGRLWGRQDGTKSERLRADARTEAPMLCRGGDGKFRPPTAVRRSGFRADWLVSYQPNPGTVVFAGYGASLGGVGSMKLGGVNSEGIVLDLQGAGYVSLAGRSKWLKAEGDAVHEF